MNSKTLDKKEIEFFDTMASNWWDEDGEMSFLHAMSEVRTRYIRDIVVNHFLITSESNKLLKGKNILDVGCGGGISTEPLARMGAKLTGIDHSKALIEVARSHSKFMNLKINYLNLDIQNLVKKKKKYDVVVALELLEHVKNFEKFCDFLTRCVNSNGIIILSTINRTYLAKLLVINIVENFIKKLPQGTHNYEKFIKPIELEKVFYKLGYRINELKGINWYPLDRWVLTKNVSVNYICSFIKN